LIQLNIQGTKLDESALEARRCTIMTTAEKAKSLPRSFRRIRLELAREPGHPAGSSQDGYVLVAPLDSDGHIDPKLWSEFRERCTVLRFRSGEEDDLGHLKHKPSGAWSFHYDVRGDEDDETGYRFQREAFVPGEYVSIHEGDGLHTFRVISVEHL
jgi:hypothetical protein